MVKRRKTSEIEQKIEEFGNKADNEKTALDPKAARNFKSITIPFNEHDFERLTTAVDDSTYSTKLAFMRAAIEEKIRREKN